MLLTRLLPRDHAPTEVAPELGPLLGEVWLDFDQRQKRRQLAVLSSTGGAGPSTGWEELRVQLERLDEPLRDGDRLCGAAGHVIVRARPEPLLVCRGEAFALLRAAYHLGNRHAKVELREGEVRTPDDPVMAAMLAQLGLDVARVEASFQPEVGAYHHHGPGHHHDEEHHHGHGAGKIHRFVLKP